MRLNTDDVRNIRNDIVCSLWIDNGELHVSVDQATPPCGDFMHVEEVAIHLPEEIRTKEIFLLNINHM